MKSYASLPSCLPVRLCSSPCFWFSNSGKALFWLATNLVLLFSSLASGIPTLVISGHCPSFLGRWSLRRLPCLLPFLWVSEQPFFLPSSRRQESPTRWNSSSTCSPLFPASSTAFSASYSL